jgi:hypothetical protein
VFGKHTGIEMGLPVGELKRGTMNTCENKAKFRYTWPGEDESLICSGHSIKLRMVADAMGLPLQLVPVQIGAGLCAQNVTGEKCEGCGGCGLIANDDDGTPWRYWEELEPPANMAVTMGMVKPVLCETCYGDCYV